MKREVRRVLKPINCNRESMKKVRWGMIPIILIVILLSTNRIVVATDWLDNFNDGNISDWTEDSGSFTAASNYLECTSAGVIYKTSTNTNGSWLFDLWEDYWFGVDQHVFFMSTLQQPNMTSGYSISLEYGGDSNVTLYRWENNVKTILGRTSLYNWTGSWTSYNVSRTSDGYFEVRRNGTVYISATDNVIIQSNYFVYTVTGVGLGLDNIGISQLLVPTTTTATTTTTSTTTTTTTTTITTGPTGEYPGPLDSVIIIGIACALYVGLPGAVFEVALNAVTSRAYGLGRFYSGANVGRINKRVTIKYSATHVKNKRYYLTVYVHNRGVSLKLPEQQKGKVEVGPDQRSKDSHEFPDESIFRIRVDCDIIFWGSTTDYVTVAKKQDVASRIFSGTPREPGIAPLEITLREERMDGDSKPIATFNAEVTIIEPPTIIRGRQVPTWLIRISVLAPLLIGLFYYIWRFWFGVVQPSNFNEYMTMMDPILGGAISLLLGGQFLREKYKSIVKELDTPRED